MKKIYVLILFLVPVLMNSQEIKWMSWEEAIVANEKNPKNIFVDVYTSWCGWCKKMESSTFKDTAIVNYMSKNFYAVKLDAEYKDTIKFNGMVFINANPSIPKSTHQLAQSLLNGQMSYPSFVILTPKVERVTIVKGYQQVSQLQYWLDYIQEKKFVEKKD